MDKEGQKLDGRHSAAARETAAETVSFLFPFWGSFWRADSAFREFLRKAVRSGVFLQEKVDFSSGMMENKKR